MRLSRCQRLDGANTGFHTQSPSRREPPTPKLLQNSGVRARSICLTQGGQSSAVRSCRRLSSCSRSGARRVSVDDFPRTGRFRTSVDPGDPVRTIADVCRTRSAHTWMRRCCTGQRILVPSRPLQGREPPADDGTVQLFQDEDDRTEDATLVVARTSEHEASCIVYLCALRRIRLCRG